MKHPLLSKQERSLQEMAQRTSLGRNTIVKIEAGDESVAMGNYFRVLLH